MTTAALVFAVLTVVLNIDWPLAHGQSRTATSIAGVISFFLCSALHSVGTQSRRFTKTLLAIMPLAFVAEAIGVHTQFPFGHYEYSDLLGLSIAHVPLLIPFAWIMMLYPTYLASRYLTASPFLKVALGAWLMATWDLYLDPQMIHEGYWTWFTSDGEATFAIPWTNFAGWFATSAVFMWLLHTNDASHKLAEVSTNTDHMSMTPAAMLLWVWIGSFVANVLPFAPYLDRPVVAFTGLIGMGVVLLPWSWKLWSQRS
jgi:uncharacterized membrane protein